MGERRPLHLDSPADGMHPGEPAAVSSPQGSLAAPAQRPQPSRRLRILCLHGFRQSARSFEGRTHALRRKLKDLADCVFVDAPHELPAWGRPQEGGQEPAAPGSGARLDTAAAAAAAVQRQHAQPRQQHHAPAAKRAWLLVQEQYAADCGVGPSSSAPSFASDPGQYEQQTAGWQESQAVIQHALTKLGPFDGVLGLSQGAAVAAVVVAQQWQAQQAQLAASGCCTCTSNGSGAEQAAQTLQFAVLCSGYCSRVPEHARLLSDAAAAGGVTVPSLHIFGGGGGDRQISTEESAALAGCFFPDQRQEVRHSAGHLIPSSGPVLSVLRQFLLQQQQQQQRQRLVAGQRQDQQHVAVPA